MSEGQVWGVVLFFFTVVLLLGGFGLYYLGGFGILAEWWEGFKGDQVVRNARAEEMRVAQKREREIGIETSWPPELVLDGAVEWMTRNGWSLQNRTQDTASFARDQGANCFLGCFLTLLFILPGILYLYLYNRTARVTVAAYPREGGSRVVLGGDEPATVQMLSDVIRSLPETPPQRATQQERPQLPVDQETYRAGSLSDKLSELAQLKEAGLITQEEYEAKRAELLGRM